MCVQLTNILKKEMSSWAIANLKIEMLRPVLLFFEQNVQVCYITNQQDLFLTWSIAFKLDPEPLN